MILPEELRIWLRRSRIWRRFNYRKYWHDRRASFYRFKCIRNGWYYVELVTPMNMPYFNYEVEEKVWYMDISGNVLPGYVSQSTFEDIWAD